MHLVEELELPLPEERLEALRQILREGRYGSSQFSRTGEVNNHVHTHYSFSPYSPAHAAFQAASAGLEAVGSVDHDSIAAAGELKAAAALLGIGGTSGFELRVNLTDTAVEGRRLNNPDSDNIAYIVVHGVPATAVGAVEEFLQPIRAVRLERNRRQLDELNRILADYDIEAIDFEREVIPLSLAREGGVMTERHILYALAGKLVTLFGRGEALLEVLGHRFGLRPSGRVSQFLADRENPHYEYDLLGILKSEFLPRFFIQPDEREAISVYTAVEFANSIGAIPAYAYLGDVGESPTGDKKAQQFEDAFLEILMPEVRRIGFKAVTYMPPRNSKEQLRRIQQFASQEDLLEISGVDINSSRQTFRCPEVMDSSFTHLNRNTWALIAHEALCSADPRYALFDPENPLTDRPLKERVERYADLAAHMDRRRPEGLIERAELLKRGS
ncbi:MAG: PHP domain-containing protein [Spirochaetaceae bacterium]